MKFISFHSLSSAELLIPSNLKRIALQCCGGFSTSVSIKAFFFLFLGKLVSAIIRRSQTCFSFFFWALGPAIYQRFKVILFLSRKKMLKLAGQKGCLWSINAHSRAINIG